MQKELKKIYQNGIKNLVKVFCQPNAWYTVDNFKIWMKNIFIKFQNEQKQKCFLILDKTPSNTNSIILDYLKNNGIEYIFIPGGLSTKLPLDISVNKYFKIAYKKKYIEFVVSNSKDFFEKSFYRETVINLVHQIWFSDEIITKNIIYNGFKTSGISFSLESSEDIQFNFDINEENEIIEEIMDNNNLTDK